MPSYRSRTNERKDTLIFLNVLKDFYPRIVDSDDKLPVWEEVLEECQKRNIFMDKDGQYLAQKRWPASIGIVKKSSKKRGPLSEKDQLIVEIERYRTPDFCYGKIEGDKDGEESTSDKSSQEVSGDDADIDDNEVVTSDVTASTHDHTFASSNDGTDNNNQPNVVTYNDPAVLSPLGVVPVAHEKTPQAHDAREISSSEPLSVNEIINEPNDDIRRQFYQSAIRAFNAYSELAEMRLQIMRHKNSPSADN